MLASIVLTIAFIIQASTGAATNSNLLVTDAWLATHLKAADISVLHVGRDRGIYDKGHIPGARFVALDDIVATRAGTPNELPPLSQLLATFEKAGIGNTGRVIVYGDDKGLLAARLLFTLDYLGHGDRIALLDGGLEEWRRAGRPVFTEAAAPAARPFTPRVNPDVLVTLSEVRDISWAVVKQHEPGWAIVDARPDAQFSGMEPGEGITRPGHIPGAASVFWERALISGDAPRLRPASELRKLLADANVAPETRVVTYCRTGVQASFAYFVAKYLGYDVKMYDGSYIEWSRATDTEVTRP